MESYEVDWCEELVQSYVEPAQRQGLQEELHESGQPYEGQMQGHGEQSPLAAADDAE